MWKIKLACLAVKSQSAFRCKHASLLCYSSAIVKRCIPSGSPLRHAIINIVEEWQRDINSFMSRHLRVVIMDSDFICFPYLHVVSYQFVVFDTLNVCCLNV